MAGKQSMIADFNSAYFRKHGTAPKPLRRELFAVQAETVILAAGCKPGRIIAEIDLESKPSWDILRNVSSGDSILARAGRGLFQLTFIRLDRHGRLVCMAFNSGRYEGEMQLSEGDVQKVWGGLLMDFRGFRLTVERLQLHQDGDGALGCIRMSAAADASLGPF
jgi:hypothetical protein